MVLLVGLFVGWLVNPLIRSLQTKNKHLNIRTPNKHITQSTNCLIVGYSFVGRFVCCFVRSLVVFLVCPLVGLLVDWLAVSFVDVLVDSSFGCFVRWLGGRLFVTLFR